MLSVIMLSVIMLSVIMVNVIVLSVVRPNAVGAYSLVLMFISFSVN